MQKARIKLASNNIGQMNEIIGSINEIAKKTKVKLQGPIPLPSKKLKLTTRKTPCGRGKATWDRFEMRIYKRLIDLKVDERTLRLVMKVPIPDSVNISIELLE